MGARRLGRLGVRRPNCQATLTAFPRPDRAVSLQALDPIPNTNRPGYSLALPVLSFQ